LFFPELASNPRMLKMESEIKKQTNLLLDEVLSLSNHEDEINKIDNFLLTYIKSSNLVGTNSVEIRSAKGFEESCFALRKNNYINPESLSVFQFYQACTIIKETNKQTGK